jgi:hypothetical protein
MGITPSVLCSMAKATSSPGKLHLTLLVGPSAHPYQLTAPISAELPVYSGWVPQTEMVVLTLIVHVPACHRCCCCRFEVRKRYWHDLTVSASQKLTVFSRGGRRFASCTLEQLQGVSSVSVESSVCSHHAPCLLAVPVHRPR